MKRNFPLLLAVTLLFLLLMNKAQPQTMNMSLRHERPMAPMSLEEINPGWGFSTSLFAAPLQSQGAGSLLAIQPGFTVDYLGHGKAEEKMTLLDPWGQAREVNIRSSSLNGSATVRFSLAERFAVRPYLGAELGLRMQSTYEAWGELSDCEDELVDINISRSFAPMMGMSSGVMVRLGQGAALDLGVDWRQTGRLNVVPLQSVVATEEFSYRYDTRSTMGQFIGFRAGITFLMTDCHPGCDHTRCCAPSRTTIQDGLIPGVHY